MTDPFDDSELELGSSVVMALQLKNGSELLGCAYYHAQEEKLYLMRDLHAGGTDYADMLLGSVNPTVILVPANATDEFLTFLDPVHMSADEAGSGSVRWQGYSIKIRPSKEFDPINGKTRIEGLGLHISDTQSDHDSDPDSAISVERQLEPDSAACHPSNSVSYFYAQVFQPECAISLGCAGAVLDHISHARESGDAGSAEVIGWPVTDLSMFCLRDRMFVNSDTIQSLQIMSTEINPHFHNQGPTGASSRNKEGLSVFGLFLPHARTPQGKALMRRYFVSPSLDVDTINARFNAVEVFNDLENKPIVKKLRKSLGAIKNIRVTLFNLQKGASLTAVTVSNVQRSVWSILREFCFNSLEIDRCIQGLVYPPGISALPIAAALHRVVNRTLLADIGSKISSVIDFELSREIRGVTIKPGFDRMLDEFRQEYSKVESHLAQIRAKVLPNLPLERFPDTVDWVYLPNIGFRLRFDLTTGHAAPQSIRERRGGSVWEFDFQIEPYAFYSSDMTKPMESRVDVAWRGLNTREIELIYELGQHILAHRDRLVMASDVCGELDVLIAFAQTAIEHNLARPVLTDQANVINIQGGRHILQELVVPSFVKNPTNVSGSWTGSRSESPPEEGLTDDWIDESDGGSAPPADHRRLAGPNVLVMTGPNFSGKSVYLKQVAIIVYLAHVGSFVPADHAQIGLTSHILTRISTRESVSKLQSAFLIDLQQVAFMLKHAGPRSLLIVDEFGKGTDSYDGAGLFSGFLKHLLSRGDECPRTIVSSHFHEIFENPAHLPLTSGEATRLGFGHMDVQVDGNPASTTGAEKGQKRMRLKDNGPGDPQIWYVYRYRPGRSSTSLGIQCARLYGIAADVVLRAEQVNRGFLTTGDLFSASARPDDRFRIAGCDRDVVEHANGLAKRFMSVHWDSVRPDEVREAVKRMWDWQQESNR